MNDETFHQSIRKFLRTVGVQSQQEIERAVAALRASGTIQGNERFPATMTLEVPGLRLNVRLDGRIDLE